MSEIKVKESMSFRMQLVLFGALLVLIVAIPILIIEIPRPWQALDNQINQGKIVVTEVKSNFTQDDLFRLNNFAFKINKLTFEETNQEYLSWAFNLLVVEESLPSESESISLLKEAEVDIPGFNYARLESAYKFWQEQFFLEPEALIMFKKYKKFLIKTRETINQAGFEFDDTYVMADNGLTLVFVIDGSQWYESTYPGLKYDVYENDCPYFRNYLKNGEGFDNDPVHYHFRVFPKFNSDKWGTWFSVWLAEEKDGSWNNFALDFDAQNVKNMMIQIGGAIIGIAFLIAVVIFLTARKISDYIATPIHYLIEGTEEVSQGNFDHLVPQAGSREFRQLIEFFNSMTVKLKGRLNLKQMLEKVLSKELAEKVEKDGMIPDGQEVEATILMTDFAGFSTIIQKLKPSQITEMLNEYYDELELIIHKWLGYSDKFIGDAMMGTFGTITYLENNAENAICCAIEMQLTIRKMNELRKKQNRPIFEMRIGLDTGKVIAGAIGSKKKIDFTSIGETVSLAQRFESSCEIGHVLIGQRTFELVQHIFFENVDFDQAPQQVKVKGYEQKVPAYNIYVTDIEIKKNPEAGDIRDFYITTEADHHLKTSQSLTPEKKQKYTKFVKLEV